MNLADIKTRLEFYDFADIWYQRSHKLRIVWQDESESKDRQLKAFKLWIEMANRVLHLNQIALKINQYDVPVFPVGGVFVV